MSPFIHSVRHLGLVDDFLGELGRNEGDSLRIAHRHVAGQHRDMTDADRHVDPHQRRVAQGGGVKIANKHVHAFDLGNAGNVAHRAIHHQPVVALGENGGGKVVTGVRSVLDLSEQIHHQHVAGRKHVNRPGVLRSDAALGLSSIIDHGVHVGALGHENGGENAAHHAPTGIDLAPSAFELIFIAVRLQHAPGFFRVHVAQTLKD